MSAAPKPPTLPKEAFGFLACGRFFTLFLSEYEASEYQKVNPWSLCGRYVLAPTKPKRRKRKHV